MTARESEAASVWEEVVTLNGQLTEELEGLRQRQEELQRRQTQNAISTGLLQKQTSSSSPAPAPAPSPTLLETYTSPQPKPVKPSKQPKPFLGFSWAAWATVFGWLFLFYFSITWIAAAVSGCSQWFRQSTVPGSLAFDPYASKLPLLPHDARILYPLQLHGNNRALRDVCQTPANFHQVTKRLVQEGGASMVETWRGPVSLRDVRHSLQTHILRGGYDYLCTQMLDIPLCYCVAVLRNGNHKEWLDLTDRVNLSCISIGATVRTHELSSLCGPQAATGSTARRFKRVCVDYVSMEGVAYRRSMTNVEAVLAQQIFEVQRGLDTCTSSLERTLEIFEKETTL